MAALTFIIYITSRQVFQFGLAFIESGFSLKKCIKLLRQFRQKYLFKRYLKEFIMECDDALKQEWEMVCSQDMDFDNIEIINGTDVTTSSTFYDAIDPNLVYSNNSLGEISEGVSFTVTGKILAHCERFSINLVLDTPTQDIALHINPRLPQNYIVRNCRIKNTWGTEEITSPLSFVLRRGQKFTIQILVTNMEYLISINGRHFASFRHRLPFKCVTCLEVKGDVENITMEKIVVSEYPEKLLETAPKTLQFTSDIESNITTLSSEISSSKQTECGLQMPFYGILPKEFLQGTLLIVAGQVKILPHSFYLNLQTGHNIWPHPTIAFHLNPRFANMGGKHVICRNSWVNGSWGREERNEQNTDFMPGKNFILSIYCTTTAYEVFLNNKFIAEYKFRVSPDNVDTVYIQGDVKLWDVSLGTKEKTENFK